MKQSGRSPLLLAGCFAFLQSADFVLTRGLLARPDMDEANPVALAVLSGHGWTGVLLLKLLCTAVVVGAGLVVCQRRPATGVRLLGGCCLIVAVVVGYSLVLLHRPVAAVDLDVVELQAEGNVLDAQIATLKEFSADRNPICRELLDGRLLLPDAVKKMAQCIDRHRSCLPPSHLARLPDTNRPTHVAAYLMFHTWLIARDPAVSRDRLAALEREAADHYPYVPEMDFAAILTGRTTPWAADAARDPV